MESPGRLPGHVTTENILNEQFARNGTIVRLINKFPDPPNKDVGEGAGDRLSRHACTPFERSDHPRERRQRNGGDPSRTARPHPEEAILAYLAKHPEINNAVARRVTGITSENKVKDVFYRLRDAGKLERVPGRKGSASAWRRPARNGFHK